MVGRHSCFTMLLEVAKTRLLSSAAITGHIRLSAQQPQAIASARVYPRADADFTLFSDDGTTYSYEHGGGSITQLPFDEATHRLTQEGAVWSGSDVTVVQAARP